MSDQFRSLFLASPVPTAIAREADGTILLANPSWLELLGWEESAVVGKSVEEIRFWARPERRALIVEELRRGGQIRDLEEEIHTNSGETLTVLLSISVLEVEGERCLVGVFHDITERRRLERRLHESEQHFRQVTETVQQGFVLRDVDPPAMLYASPAVGRIFGVDHDLVYSHPLTLEGLIHPDDRQGVLARRGAMTGPKDEEFRIVRPDGEARWVRTRAEPVRIENGQVTRIAAVIDDVTEERELREALRESEERFRLLAENSTDVISRASPDATLLYVSPASRRLYGYDPPELIGRSGRADIHPEDHAALREEAQKREDGGDELTFEYRFRRKDGSFVWVETKTRTLRDPRSGAVVEYQSSTRDIGERKLAEATARTAQAQAEQANGAKSEFLSRMSHELRTPLHAILGFGELLGQEELSAPQRDKLVQLVRPARHLLDLINEVLDLSRIERGELRLSLEPVHVGDVINETLSMVLPLAAAASVAVTSPPDEDLEIHVLADRQRFKQVLLNLCSNAVKYNRRGGTVTLRCSAASRSAHIEVVDTGIGIAPDDLPRVFEPFDRLGAETTDVEGTGLGLALSKRLMDAMGGEITVESAIGHGTTCRLELPVVPAPAAPRRPPRGESPVSAPDPSGRPRTVLYVEDNPSNIKLVEAILSARSEVTLLVGTQGSLAIELAREHRPALILLDLNLPDISGEEVLRRIRGDARTAEIPVVITSADATPGRVERLRRAGADDYLTKPFTIERLLAVIDGSPAADEAEPRDKNGSLREAPVLEPRAIKALQELANRPNVGAAVISQLVNTYITDALERCSGIETATRIGDLAEVQRQAHALGGASGWAGATELLRRCRALEATAGQGDHEGVRTALAGLDLALADARSALEAEFGRV